MLNNLLGHHSRKIGLAITLVALASAAHADAVHDCTKSTVPEDIIRGCTSLLRSKRYKDNHNLSVIYSNRGMGFSNTGDRERGIDDQTQALRHNPRNLMARRNRARDYWALGRYEEALSDMSEVIKIEPRNADNYALRGAIHEANNGEVYR